MVEVLGLLRAAAFSNRFGHSWIFFNCTMELRPKFWIPARSSNWAMSSCCGHMWRLAMVCAWTIFSKSVCVSQSITFSGSRMETQPYGKRCTATCRANWRNSQFGHTNHFRRMCESNNALNMPECACLWATAGPSDAIPRSVIPRDEQWRRNVHERSGRWLHRTSRLRGKSDDFAERDVRFDTYSLFFSR